MADPIEVCIGLLTGKDTDAKNSSKNSSNEPAEKPKPITGTEYIAGWMRLTIVDFLLVAFLVSGIIGVFLSRDKGSNLIRFAFLGIISFITLKTMNTKLLSDLCMTCQGLNPLQLTRRIDVVLSFVWANIQTFVGLILNVLYYFLVFYMVYLLLRSHLFYRFGDHYQANYGLMPMPPNAPPEQEQYNDYRIMSRIHSRMSTLIPEPGKFKIPYFIIPLVIYWLILLGSIIGVFMFLIMMIADAAAGGKNKTVSKIKKAMGNGIMAAIVPPFLATAITLILKFASRKKSLTFLNRAVARRIIPVVNFSTITAGFNFVDSTVLKNHTIAFVIAITAAVIYALIFLKPIDKKNVICDAKGEVANDSPEFLEFKNRFVMGHYIIGVIVLMSYVTVFGGKIGMYAILIALSILAVLYLCIYVLAPSPDSSESSESDEINEDS